ncbi:spore coat putative kinase YutH [Bacillus sp. FJAT-27251]|uniref:spore coat putative kinase YutH n=1 Tax=Bacillus sp. FJAT-27251 TaxID=1684142 RepID=UPI0006A792FA|nr:spore coat protein YutH [Bacillus sp. FJAT-27251]
MFEKMIKEKYGIKEGHELDIEKYRAYKQDKTLYLIITATGRKEQEISELEKIAGLLRSFGDKEIPQFVRTKDGAQVCEWEGSQYCLLQYPGLKTNSVEKMGSKLARLHWRGRYMPFQVKTVNRIGQWKQLWEKRLDQMENVWNGKLMQEPENEFEKMFLDSFPYYMGLAENAIQYLADTELDGQPTETDNGTVCHERYTARTWGKYVIKNPFDWVFDHPSRDLAEWIRERYFYNTQTYQPAVRKFIASYQQGGRLSPFAWRLLYSRLLFPLHYFECVEGYYITGSEQQKLALEDQLLKHLKMSGEHERFLGGFYQLAEAPARALKLPSISWINK